MAHSSVFHYGGRVALAQRSKPPLKGPQKLRLSTKTEPQWYSKVYTMKSVLPQPVQTIAEALAARRARPARDNYGCEVNLSQQRGWGALPPPQLDQRHGFKSTPIYNAAISGSTVNLI